MYLDVNVWPWLRSNENKRPRRNNSPLPLVSRLGKDLEPHELDMHSDIQYCELHFTLLYLHTTLSPPFTFVPIYANLLDHHPYQFGELRMVAYPR